jgi:hypothetical protein
MCVRALRAAPFVPKMKKTAGNPAAPQNIKNPFEPIEVLQCASALTRK